MFWQSAENLQSGPQSLFNPDEKKVLSVIRDHGMQIKQKDIALKLDWSRSKVSAIVSNLEYKKVIRREKTGRNFDITLVQQFED